MFETAIEVTAGRDIPQACELSSHAVKSRFPSGLKATACTHPPCGRLGTEQLACRDIQKVDRLVSAGSCDSLSVRAKYGGQDHGLVREPCQRLAGKLSQSWTSPRLAQGFGARQRNAAVRADGDGAHFGRCGTSRNRDRAFLMPWSWHTPSPLTVKMPFASGLNAAALMSSSDRRPARCFRRFERPRAARFYPSFP